MTLEGFDEWMTSQWPLSFLYRYANVLNKASRKTLCSALIQCHFDYSISSWYSGLSAKSKGKLNRFLWAILSFNNILFHIYIYKSLYNINPVLCQLNNQNVSLYSLYFFYFYSRLYVYYIYNVVFTTNKSNQMKEVCLWRHDGLDSATSMTSSQLGQVKRDFLRIG